MAEDKSNLFVSFAPCRQATGSIRNRIYVGNCRGELPARPYARNVRHYIAREAAAESGAAVVKLSRGYSWRAPLNNALMSRIVKSIHSAAS